MALTKIGTTGIADDSITLAKMASGTDGNLITYDTNTNPAYVVTGTDTQVLTSNGPDQAPTFQAAAGGGGGAVTRVGGDTSEGTTTSTSSTELSAITSLTIAVASPFTIRGDARCSEGTNADASVGLRINAIILGTPSSSGGGCWVANSANQNEDGFYTIDFGARLTNYLNSATACFMSRVTSTAVVTNSAHPAVDALETAVMPNAIVADIDTLGLTGNAAVTLGIDATHVYTWASS